MSLGAIRTQELLASRRIDGAEQFFTRAYDFGYARSSAEVFSRWARDSLVGDVVAVIRAFRPQVIVTTFVDTVSNDGQQQALAEVASQAFTASTDARRYPSGDFGAPWSVAKLYHHGHGGLHIETAEYDQTVGKSYPTIAMESRAQQRTQGLRDVVRPPSTVVELRQVGSHGAPIEAGAGSLFAGVDTGFARLAVGVSPDMAAALAQLTASADSARRAIAVNDRSRAIPYLAQVARAANRVRVLAKWCGHPFPYEQTPILALGASPPVCDASALDLDASIDLVRDRAVAALLSAAGIAFEATADRELVASSDSAVVTVTMVNRGVAAVTFADLSVSGDANPTMTPLVVSPDSSVRVTRTVTGLEDPHPWWIGNRTAERYPVVLSALDGLSRVGMLPRIDLTPSVAAPENIRRTSDATVTVTVAGVTVRTSLGAVLFRYADAQLGVQERPLAGIPDVTFRFDRPLVWIPSTKPVMRSLRVVVTSHSDRGQQITLKTVLPPGLHIDSLPHALTVEPHDQRDLLIRIRGAVQGPTRTPFGVIGMPVDDSSALGYQTGFRIVQRDYLPPIRLFGSSGLWVQPIDIEVPPTLTVLYVPGIGEDLASALRDVGVVSKEVTPDELLSTDLSRITTVALGARALEAHPELSAQMGRLLDFVRGGGTLVVLRGDAATTSSRLFGAPVAVASPVAARVGRSDAPVTVLDPKARLLNWPNVISPTDWAGWVAERAPVVPTSADAMFTKLIESHDPDEPENRNAILVSHLGKGTIVYTALTLDQQIAGGVPGALRLLLNMLSAGLPPAR